MLCAVTQDEPAGSTPGRRRWLLAVVAVGAVVAIFITTGGEDDPAPEATRPAPTARPLELTTMPWSPSVEPGTLPQLRDDTVLFVDLHNSDGDFGDERRMVLADARTGEHRWTLVDELRGGGLVWDSLHRPHLVAHPTGVAVLVQYCVVTCVGNAGSDGIALLSGQDGSVLWQSPTVDGAKHHTIVWTAEDDTVMVTVQPGAGIDFPPERLNEVRVLAFEVLTGAERWETHGMWPVRTASGVLLGAVGKYPPTRKSDVTAPLADLATVTALDLATGSKLWDFADRARSAQVVAVAGDTALLFGHNRVRQVVDVRTGREIAEFPDVWSALDCAGSLDTTLIACATTDGRAIRTFDSADRSTAVSVGDLGGGISLDTVWRDRILDWRTEDAPYTFDRAGNRIDTRLPGIIIASSGDLVLTAAADYSSGTGRQTETEIAVHQVSR
jgi:hypothetical protein